MKKITLWVAIGVIIIVLIQYGMSALGQSGPHAIITFCIIFFLVVIIGMIYGSMRQFLVLKDDVLQLRGLFSTVRVPVKNIERLYVSSVPNDPGAFRALGPFLDVMRGMKYAGNSQNRRLYIPTGTEAQRMIAAHGQEQVWIDVRTAGKLRSYSLTSYKKRVTVNKRSTSIGREHFDTILRRLAATLPAKRIDSRIKRTSEMPSV